eukprot:CAMPEP_0172496406 /NCGR_PEP_ID=MMETSP1066-20121228/86853_1 /TAXON_ID=671091 /ORGANISM="Coscinodiscus wailesii, Strain CCMP2513" /LENGTH=375 /DNA_ID=CAMNT_0013268695 /DNA_START=92 /DNA_END=1219 /DNA_ORIENTATION=+
MTIAPIRHNGIMCAARTMVSESQRNDMSSGSQYFLDGLLEKAKVRWLKVPEIEYLLDPATSPLPILAKLPCVRPKSGTVLLFDRNVTTNYKEDGYSWIKKRNSSKVREDHVKLRANGEFRVAGMYRHCSNPISLHRRAYHLLDPTTGATRTPIMKKMKKNRDSFNANITPSLVLVHYLDTVEAAECTFVSSTRQSKGSFGGKRKLADIEEPAIKKSRVQRAPSCNNEILPGNEMEPKERNVLAEPPRNFEMCNSSPVVATFADIREETESYPRNVGRETETSYFEKVTARVLPYDILSNVDLVNNSSSENVYSNEAPVAKVSDEEYEERCDDVFSALWEFVKDSTVKFEETIEFPDSAEISLTPEFLTDLDYLFD